MAIGSVFGLAIAISKPREKDFESGLLRETGSGRFQCRAA
jgi:hypothetical protein